VRLLEALLLSGGFQSNMKKLIGVMKFSCYHYSDLKKRYLSVVYLDFLAVLGTVPKILG